MMETKHGLLGAAAAVLVIVAPATRIVLGVGFVLAAAGTVLRSRETSGWE